MSSPVIVLKIGTNSITKGCDQGINLQVINKLAEAASKLQDKGFRVIITSSGAMGLGIAKLGSENIEKKLEASPCKETLLSYKQALTSVGQAELINAYQSVFQYYSKHAGQVLVTHLGLDDQARNETVKNTLETMFELDLIPIVNANDTVSSKELEYGDNDSLSARIAILMKAQRLIILSDVDGFYDSDPSLSDSASLIKFIENIDEDLLANAGDSSKSNSTGGMKSKLMAAKTCQEENIPVDIINANNIQSISSIVENPKSEIRGTRILVS